MEDGGPGADGGRRTEDRARTEDGGPGADGGRRTEDRARMEDGGPGADGGRRTGDGGRRSQPGNLENVKLGYWVEGPGVGRGKVVKRFKGDGWSLASG